MLGMEQRSFSAQGLHLRRGQKRIWEDANWTLHENTVLIGENGAGKSSTIAMLAGQLAPDHGHLHFLVRGEEIGHDEWMRRVSLCAPWSSLPLHLSLEKMLNFHQSFRKPREGSLHFRELIRSSGLNVPSDLPMRDWSSGQKQRLQLALAFGTEADALLLDEPGSNLDQSGLDWLHGLYRNLGTQSLVVVATNDPKKEGPQAPSILEIRKKIDP